MNNPKAAQSNTNKNKIMKTAEETIIPLNSPKIVPFFSDFMNMEANSSKKSKNPEVIIAVINIRGTASRTSKIFSNTSNSIAGSRNGALKKPMNIK
jgi:hypothetical protein